MKKRIRILFRNGKEVVFNADEITVTTDASGNIIRLEADGMSKINGLVYANLSEIVCVYFNKENA